MSPRRTAVLAQLIGSIIAAATTQILYPWLFTQPALWAIAQGICAALVSYKLGASRWWIPIHLGFLPLAVAAGQLGIPPLTWLGGFVLLLLLFWRIDKSQVPLYLTNHRTARAAADLLPASSCNFIDLGCGTGSLLHYLAKNHPNFAFVGIEHAPLPFLRAWLRGLRTPNLTIRYGDFWHEDLGSYQVVYAFLSPVPMTRLWQKARAEMSPHSLLISNSFEISDTTPLRIVEVPDRRRTRLFCYSPAAGK